MKYRKKPIVVEAIKWTGDNVKEISKFMGVSHISYDLWNCKISIATLEGIMEASMGDYIIKGVQGEFYLCKPDIFKKNIRRIRVFEYFRYSLGGDPIS